MKLINEILGLLKKDNPTTTSLYVISSNRDLEDQANEPTLIAGSSMGKRSRKMVYDYFMKNSDKLKNMDFSGVWNMMTNELKVYPHHYLAVD